MQIVYYAACSLDGYIATPDGGVEWLGPYHGEGDEYGFADFNRSIDVLLMGSRTYEFALAQPTWPSPDKPSWVFTRRDLPVAHPSITLTGDDPDSVVRALREKGHRRAWLMGGGVLAGSFQKQKLISDYIISVIPVLLGEGIPLFAGEFRFHTLRFVSSKAFSMGVVQLAYEQTGE